MKTFHHRLAFVLRNADGRDCTANGMSSRCTMFYLVWATENGTIVNTSYAEAQQYVTETGLGKPTDHDPQGTPVGYLVVRTLFAAEKASWHIRPLEIPEGKWTMFGGNWAYSSDSYFPVYHPNGFSTPIAIHDRVEE